MENQRPGVSFIDGDDILHRSRSLCVRRDPQREAGFWVKTAPLGHHHHSDSSILMMLRDAAESSLALQEQSGLGIRPRGTVVNTARAGEQHEQRP